MFLLIIAAVLLVNCSATNIAANDSNASGYDMLLAKMDYLEYKFLELQMEVKEQSETIQHKQETNKRAILEQTSEILEQQKMFSNHASFMQSIFELQPKKHPSDNSKLNQSVTEGEKREESEESEESQFITSCGSDSVKQSGRYFLYLDNITQFEVYCEHELHGGGWLVFQNRFNGSVDFYKNWTDYKHGFGSLDGEFWIGLDRIAELTSLENRTMLVHLEDFNEVVKHALYESFAIGDEEEFYALKTLSGYSGTAGDSLEDHARKKFSTLDRDNDTSDSNCAAKRHGSWWYHGCSSSNLNGLYTNTKGDMTMNWYAFGFDRRGLKVSKMMIKY